MNYTDLTEADKRKCYMHYIIRLLSLKHFHNAIFNRKTFNEFCNVTDDRVSEGLPGTFWRFKQQIFNL